MFRLFCALTLIVYWASPSEAREPISPTQEALTQDSSCSVEDVKSADQALRRMKDWSGAYYVFKRYGNCNDGEIGEGYSGAIIWLLVNRWESLRDLNSIVERDPEFGRFVLSHLDILMSPTEAGIIQMNAEARCPRDTALLCQKISYRLKHLSDQR
jgi:hypothetical protein